MREHSNNNNIIVIMHNLNVMTLSRSHCYFLQAILTQGVLADIQRANSHLDHEILNLLSLEQYEYP